MYNLSKYATELSSCIVQGAQAAGCSTISLGFSQEDLATVEIAKLYAHEARPENLFCHSPVFRRDCELVRYQSSNAYKLVHKLFRTEPVLLLLDVRLSSLMPRAWRFESGLELVLTLDECIGFNFGVSSMDYDSFAYFCQHDFLTACGHAAFALRQLASF